MSLLLSLAVLASPAAATERAPFVTAAPGALCATPLLLQGLLPVGPEPLPPPGAVKQQREAIEGVTQVRGSANFAVKWGAAAAVDEAQVQVLLEGMEQAWSVQMVEMEHPEPYGTGTYLLNVYIEDTGLVWTSGGSSYELRGSGAAGYYTTDPEGHPMLVMSSYALGTADYTRAVAAHELYHAVQAGMGAYPYRDRAAWYWEATASWMAGEVFPDIPSYADFLFGYALLPWLPLAFFDYPDTGALQEYRQYGAFILPRHLSEVAADWSVVRDSWTRPDPGGDPVLALDEALLAYDTTVADELAAMTARLAAWDYRDGEVYRANVEGYGSYYPDGDRLQGEVGAAGTDGWVQPDADQLPRATGSNLVSIAAAAEDRTLELQLDAQGEAGSEAMWRVILVEPSSTGPSYRSVELEEGAASVLLPAGVETRWLAVTVDSQARDADEVFAWSYRVGAVEEEPAGEDTGLPAGAGGGGEPIRACGCASGGGPAGRSWLAVLVGLAGLAVARRGSGLG